MVDKNVIIIRDGQEIDRVESLADYSITDDYAVLVNPGGSVVSTDVLEGGTLQALGGTVSETRVTQGGQFDVQSGNVEDTLVLTGGCLVTRGTLTETTVIGGTVSVQNGGNALGVFVSGDGAVDVQQGGFLSDLQLYSGSVSLNGGNASSLTVQDSRLDVANGSLAVGVCIIGPSAYLTVSADSTILATELDGTSADIQDGALACNTKLLSYARDDETGVIYTSTLTLHSGAWHYGTLFIDSRSSLIAEDGSVIDFTLAASTAGRPLVNDFSRITGSPDYTMTVSEEQADGIYALAGNAAAFDAAVTLQCNDFGTMTMSVGETAVYHNSVYALALDDGMLAAIAADYQTTASADALFWEDINGASAYELKLSSGDESQTLEITTCGVELLGLAKGDYTWRVRNAAESDNWQTGEAFSQTADPEGPQKLEATIDGATDVFLVRTDGVWNKKYQACHVGMDGWSGTGELVDLAGKARITDIFAGSEDASILACSVHEAQTSGVALFLDDIYSAMPSCPQASGRLSQINTILATDGADIIDLTSQRFVFNGGVTVRGGAGDDVIWANSGANSLFGGDGNDSIVGGSGDDVIIGGDGNDTLHGGGGSDAFVFGGNWGVDVVSQREAGTIVLAFEGVQRSDLELSGDADGHAVFSQGENRITLKTIQFADIQQAWSEELNVLSDTLSLTFDDASPVRGHLA